jgi:hypothetical protein
VGVVALTGAAYFLASTYKGPKAPTAAAPPAASKSDAKANAAEAQKWINAWKSKSKAAAPGASSQKTAAPLPNVADAQKWIDAFKSKSKK